MFRNEVLLQEIIEGRMKGKACKSYLASSAKYLKAKTAADTNYKYRAYFHPIANLFVVCLPSVTLVRATQGVKVYAIFFATLYPNQPLTSV